MRIWSAAVASQLCDTLRGKSRNSRAPESLAMASYISSIHLSRALSPLLSSLAPSALSDLTTPGWDWVGVEAVGVGAGVDTDCGEGADETCGDGLETCGDGLEAAAGMDAWRLTEQYIRDEHLLDNKRTLGLFWCWC